MENENRGRHLAGMSNGSASGSSSSHMPRNGGFCGALQRAPPPIPPGLARRLASRECYGVGKVKVMLRVADRAETAGVGEPHFLALDKKKRQVTLTDPKNVCAPQAQERAPMVAAPKMFAFDNVFSAEDKQVRQILMVKGGARSRYTRIEWVFEILKIERNYKAGQP